MRYIKRFIEDDLLQWKNDNIGADHKYVMEITGSRQVGKTTTVLHFANKNYKHVVYVNVGKQSDVVDMSNPGIYSIEDRVMQFCSTRNLTLPMIVILLLSLMKYKKALSYMRAFEYLTAS